MLKALSTIFIIALTVINFGCASSAPKPPVVPVCDMIAVQGGNPYLRCKWSSGGETWRIPISTIWQRPEKYICTTDQGYADGEDYGRALKRWTDQHCQ